MRSGRGQSQQICMRADRRAQWPTIGSRIHRDWARPFAHLHRDWGSPLPHLHRDWAHSSHICAGTGLAPSTSASGLGSPLPHLHRDTGSHLPHLHRDGARPCHICTGTVRTFDPVKVVEAKRNGWDEVVLRQVHVQPKVILE